MAMKTRSAFTDLIAFFGALAVALAPYRRWLVLGLVLLIVLAAIFVLILFVYQVRQSEVAVVTRFGKPHKTKTTPGYDFRLPPGIDSVYKLDQRIQNFEDSLSESYTADGNNLLTSVYVGWKISDAKSFFPKFAGGSVSEAQRMLESTLRSAKSAVITHHTLSEFVNANPQDLQFDAIEQEIARDHELLGFGRYARQAKGRRDDARVHRSAAQARLLAVLHQDRVQHFRILKRLAHHRCIGDANTIIRKGHGAALLHQRQLGQFHSFATLGDSADRIDIGQPHPLRLAQDKFNLPLIIQRRLGIGHAADAGESARNGRGRPGGDVFLLFVARLAKVHVNVDQTRRDQAIGGVDHPIGLVPRRHGGDFAFFDKNIAPAFDIS